MKQLDYKRINYYIKQIANKDESGFDNLFVYTYKNMEIIAKYYLINKSSAEDVLLELYKKVLLKATTFDFKKNGYNWMYTITKNLALDENKRTCRIEYVGDNYCKIEDKSYEPLKTMIVEELMSILNDKEKKLLYQIFWEGYTIKEIAKMEKVPIATIYTQRARVCKKIKKFYKVE